MAVKILCIGDLHLGRIPSKIPDELERESFSPRLVLQRAIKFAIDQQVELVLFSGDLIDSESAYFEGYSAISSAIRELLSYDIAVCAVCGNHDFDILRSLSQEIPELHLLGINGWSDYVHQSSNGDSLRILGRSFSDRFEPDNPLKNFPKTMSPLPTIGLLHADVGAKQSNYFPVQLTQLTSLSPLAWVLGHIHVPKVLSETPLVLYAGSLQGLDPGETGSHGPWLIEVTGHRVTSCTHVPLAALRYEDLTIDVDGCTSVQVVKERLLRRLRVLAEAIQLEQSPAQYVSLRLTLQGACEAYHELSESVDSITEETSFTLEGLSVRIERVLLDVRPTFSLAEIARGNDPAALVARRLIVLQDGAPRDEYTQLLERASKRAKLAHDNPHFSSVVTKEQLSHKAVRELLLSSGMRLLGELVKQAEGVR